MESSGFTTVEPDPRVATLNVGMLGYRFMAKAHSNAWKTMPYIFWPPEARPHLRAIAGRNAQAVAESAQRFGFDGYYTSWEALVADPEIDIFDNCSSHHMHLEPSIAALEAGKHVVCEKPLALSADDAYRMLESAVASGRHHMTGFNYRFIPAVQFARKLIARGALGEIAHARVQYLQQSLHDPDRPLGKVPEAESARAGSQAIIGCHAVDQMRYLVGEIATVSARTQRMRDQRSGPNGSMVNLEWDDATVSLVEYENGAVGTIEASRLATGRANSLRWEINGSRGSIAFDLERLNELQVYLADASMDDIRGFTDVMVTQPGHPFSTVWWPNGHILGWEHAHINELLHFLACIARSEPIDPIGATFEDGYRAAEIADALIRSSASGRRETIAYRSPQPSPRTENPIT
jgi:predicted dehydrogenase